MLLVAFVDLQPKAAASASIVRQMLKNWALLCIMAQSSLCYICLKSDNELLITSMIFGDTLRAARCPWLIKHTIAGFSH